MSRPDVQFSLHNLFNLSTHQSGFASICKQQDQCHLFLLIQETRGYNGFTLASTSRVPYDSRKTQLRRLHTDRHCATFDFPSLQAEHLDAGWVGNEPRHPRASIIRLWPPLISSGPPFHRSHANIHRRSSRHKVVEFPTRPFRRSFSQLAPLPRGAAPADNPGPAVGGEIDIDPLVNVIERALGELLQSARNTEGHRQSIAI